MMIYYSKRTKSLFKIEEREGHFEESLGTFIVNVALQMRSENSLEEPFGYALIILLLLLVKW